MKPFAAKRPVKRLKTRPGKMPAAANIAIAFGCGGGVVLLLLSAFAFVMECVALPTGAVEPLASVAAGCGIIVTALVLGGSIGHSRLLCGIGCGAVYLLCLAAATLICKGYISMNAATGIVSAVFILSGAVGGVISAARVQSGAPLR